MVEAEIEILKLKKMVVVIMNGLVTFVAGVIVARMKEKFSGLDRGIVVMRDLEVI